MFTENPANLGDLTKIDDILTSVDLGDQITTDNVNVVSSIINYTFEDNDISADVFIRNLGAANPKLLRSKQVGADYMVMLV